MTESRLESIKCVLGNDHTVHEVIGNHGTADDPSGFEEAGFSENEIQCILDTAKQTLVTIFGEAPSSVIDNLPDSIPFYWGRTPVHRPLLINRANFSTTNVFSNGISRMPSTLRGILLDIELSNDGLSSNDIKNIGHELTHIPLNDIFVDDGVNEAVAQRLTQLTVGVKDNDAINYISGDVTGTCGLRCSDGGRYSDNHINGGVFSDHHIDVRRLRYAVAATALQEATAAEIWSLIANLTEKAQEGQPMVRTSNEEVDDAIRFVFGKKAESILSKPSFQPIQKGLQNFSFPINPSAIGITSIRFLKNTAFGETLENGNQVVIETILQPESTDQARLHGLAKDGEEIASRSITLLSYQELKYETCMKFFKDRWPNHKLPIEEFVCDTGVSRIAIPK